jgi:hypothetical protein
MMKNTASDESAIQETIKFARAGFVLQDIPAKYRPGTSLPAGISPEGICFVC